jgi:shikimate kinase
VTKNLFLIGARGTGKTTVGRLVAERLGWRFCDADVLLEERAGKTIRAIFETEGEAAFRDRESALLAEIAGRQDHVVATGGGVVLRAENRLCLARGDVVWLRAEPVVLWQRLQQDASTAERRPDLAQGGLAEIEEVLRIRAPLYERCADLAVDADTRTPDEVSSLILAWHRGEP